MMRTGGFALIALLALIALFWVGLGESRGALVFSFILAYLVFPLVQKLEKKGVPRALAASSFLLLLFFLGVGAFLLVVPAAIKDINAFLHQLPQAAKSLFVSLKSTVEAAGYSIEVKEAEIEAWARSSLSSVSVGMLKTVSGTVGKAFGGVLGSLLTVMGWFMIPVFFLYILTDYERVYWEMRSLLPRKVWAWIQAYGDEIGQVFSGYVRGQLMVACSLAVIYSIGLTLVGMKFSLAIGLIAGFLSVIPYVGFSVGIIGSVVVLISQQAEAGVIAGVVVVFAVAQTLEGFVLTPKLVGDKVGLGAFATLLALIIGGNLAGFPGLLLAIPCAAVLKKLYDQTKKNYQLSEVYARLS